MRRCPSRTPSLKWRSAATLIPFSAKRYVCSERKLKPLPPNPGHHQDLAIAPAHTHGVP